MQSITVEVEYLPNIDKPSKYHTAVIHNGKYSILV